jgi:hypothetical protein
VEKIKYKGVFVFPSKVLILYTFAYSERQAWLRFCKRMAKMDGVHPSEVMALFKDGNYTISKEE